MEDEWRQQDLEDEWRQLKDTKSGCIHESNGKRTQYSSNLIIKIAPRACNGREREGGGVLGRQQRNYCRVNF